MNEHINGAGACYCGSLDCLNHLRVMLDSLSEKLTRTEAIRDSYKAHGDKVRQYIQASIDREDWTSEELAEPFWEELAEILDLSISREVEVYLDIRVLARVTKPLSADLNAYDFDLDALEISANESGWEIEIDESEITDVSEV